MLGDAEILFDSPAGLAEIVAMNQRLRFVQATAGGAGEQVDAAGLSSDDLRRIWISCAAGVYDGPVFEFSLFGLLAFTKDLPRLLDDKAEHRWDRHPVGELAGRTVLLVGLGTIGLKVARLAKAFRMHVIGFDRTGDTSSPDVDETGSSSALVELVGDADAVVVTLPLTKESKGMLDADFFAAMRDGAVFVNVGRGAVIDESALAAALADGHRVGAAIDVFANEPLESGSPPWERPNVLLSPHTAALSVHENERIVELFADNLRRYLTGDDLIGLVHPKLMY